MPASAAPTKTRKRGAKRASKQPLPAELQDVLESIERLRALDLPEEDGEPLETDYHRVQIALLDEVVRQLLGDTNDYFCGGNMFVYYSYEQAVEVIGYVKERKPPQPRYKGPDFFLVKEVDGAKPRGKWVVWEEGGKYPDLIIELVSPSTAKKDKQENPEFYARVFHTPEYFWYDPFSDELKGYRLVVAQYEPIPPNERGWLWSNVLGAYVGVWDGVWQGRQRRWIRLYDSAGNLIPTQAEREAMRAEQERQRAEQERQRAEQERQRAEQERQRAEQERQLREQAEAELERLKAKLRELGIEP
ncbi:MAG: Uma2 family endonuclease [Fimbriimonadales bacterium]|nr:Uma2 family endonuclease [Fimbriimonadales bacterium]MCS7191193.1 Uma2 family endonuclease [Fimbriimonadales bacterium]